MRIKIIVLFCSFMQIAFGQVRNHPNLDEQLRQYYPDGEAPGIAVRISQGGKLSYQFNQGLANLDQRRKNNGDTHFRMASISKQVTASAVYKLVESGKISLDNQLQSFFTGLPSALRNITIQQLLQHSSGVMDYESLLPEKINRQLTDEDVLHYVKQKNELYFSPGSNFRYSNTGYCLLSLIVANVSSKAFATFVQQELFTPAQVYNGLVYFPYSKIENRAYGYHPVRDFYVYADQSSTSATQGDGGVYFSAKDYHIWMSHQLEKKLHDGTYQSFLQKYSHYVTDDIAYSMGWFYKMNEHNQPILFHSGESTGFHNIVYVNVEKDLVISFFSNRDDNQIAAAFDTILLAAGEKSPIGNTRNTTVFEWLNQVYASEFSVK